MLKKRIIPKLLLKQMSFGALKKDVIITTKAFAGSSIVGDPISQAKVCESQQSDELIFLDIEATAAGRTVTVDLLRKLAENLFDQEVYQEAALVYQNLELYIDLEPTDEYRYGVSLFKTKKDKTQCIIALE